MDMGKVTGSQKRKMRRHLEELLADVGDGETKLTLSNKQLNLRRALSQAEIDGLPAEFNACEPVDVADETDYWLATNRERRRRVNLDDAGIDKPHVRRPRRVRF